MPGEVPYTSQLPYLVHPAMKTHPSFVPPTDGSMIQGASPLYANFVPPTQVGGYAGTNQGYCGNTYLPDQQAPVNNASGVGSGLVNSTAAGAGMQMGVGTNDPLAAATASQLSDIQKLQILQARAAQAGGSVLNLAPNDQNFVQASGQQNLLFGPGGQFTMMPAAMLPQNNWLHAQAPDRTPHLSTPIGMPPGTICHSQPTTFVNVYQVPSGWFNAFNSIFVQFVFFVRPRMKNSTSYRGSTARYLPRHWAPSIQSFWHVVGSRFLILSRSDNFLLSVYWVICAAFALDNLVGGVQNVFQ